MVVPDQNPLKDEVLKLMNDKDELEAKISEYGAVLEANDNVGMNGLLVDADGFPRNDIDVYRVRQARQQIICLQNDHKELMKIIEQKMHALHAQSAEHKPKETNGQEDANAGAVGSSNVDFYNSHTLVVAIAKVNMVSPGSPAEEAGLRVDDEIIEFGTVNQQNFNNDLNSIANVVRHMVNRRISLKVLRDHTVLDLVLIPRTWSGRGLLGCNIVLPEAVER